MHAFSCDSKASQADPTLEDLVTFTLNATKNTWNSPVSCWEEVLGILDIGTNLPKFTVLCTV